MKSIALILSLTVIVGCSNSKKKPTNIKNKASVGNQDNSKITNKADDNSKDVNANKSNNTTVNNPVNVSTSSQNTKNDLIFAGTVKEIKAVSVPRSRFNWVVTFNVNKVKSGIFSEKTFSFRIHSPAKSGLKVGLKYVVKAKRIKTGYQVDPYQWMKKH